MRGHRFLLRSGPKERAGRFVVAGSGRNVVHGRYLFATEDEGGVIVLLIRLAEKMGGAVDVSCIYGGGAGDVSFVRVSPESIYGLIIAGVWALKSSVPGLNTLLVALLLLLLKLKGGGGGPLSAVAAAAAP